MNDLENQIFIFKKKKQNKIWFFLREKWVKN